MSKCKVDDKSLFYPYCGPVSHLLGSKVFWVNRIGEAFSWLDQIFVS
jgi:hypothetical protein